MANELSLLDAFAAILNELDNMSHVSFLTGANPVFGLTLAGRVRYRLRGPKFFHLAPTSDPDLLVKLKRPLGQHELWIDDVGATMEDRQELLIESCDLVFAFGGGPGTARELEICAQLGKRHFRVRCTGGAAEAHRPHSFDSDHGPLSTHVLTPHEAVDMATDLMEIAENFYKVKY